LAALTESIALSTAAVIEATNELTTLVTRFAKAVSPALRSTSR
jgi:hypothetical protein